MKVEMPKIDMMPYVVPVIEKCQSGCKVFVGVVTDILIQHFVK